MMAPSRLMDNSLNIPGRKDEKGFLEMSQSKDSGR